MKVGYGGEVGRTILYRLSLESQIVLEVLYEVMRML
jgi:hypothetical protein